MTTCGIHGDDTSPDLSGARRCRTCDGLDPLVSVRHPIVPREAPEGGMVEIDNMIEVACSAHPGWFDWAMDLPSERHRLQRLAAAHANVEHDGLVEAVGWSR